MVIWITPLFLALEGGNFVLGGKLWTPLGAKLFTFSLNLGKSYMVTPSFSLNFRKSLSGFVAFVTVPPSLKAPG